MPRQDLPFHTYLFLPFPHSGGAPFPSPGAFARCKEVGES